MPRALIRKKEKKFRIKPKIYFNKYKISEGIHE
jgi:hypothetical protein